MHYGLFSILKVEKLHSVLLLQQISTCMNNEFKWRKKLLLIESEKLAQNWISLFIFKKDLEMPFSQIHCGCRGNISE